MLYNIADLFCGAGGTSTGAIEALEKLGKTPRLTAINHWQVAVATHTANHPSARHLCASLDSLNPRDLFKEGELDLLWASPECTHHSQARGGKPILDQSRATAWCVVRWAEALRPNVILVENVPEFQTWGPINTKGRPIASRKGEVFQSWLNNLRAIGYTVDFRVLNAADYGDPTTRRRLFIQAVRGKRRIVWPEPTHCEPEKLAERQGDLFGCGLKPWVPAKAIIDWSNEGQSIFERKRPLSPKTMARIEQGLRKFGLAPFITPQQTNPTPKSVNEPLSTVVAEGSGPKLVQPFLVMMEHGGSIRNADKPVPTVTCAKGGAIGIAAPFLVHTAHGGERPTHDVENPLPTVAGNRGDLAVCEPHLLPQGGGGVARPVSDPAPTVACDGAIGLVEPFLVEYYGKGNAQSVNKPVGTATCKTRFGLVRPEVVVDGKRYLLDIRFRMLQPDELALAQGFRKDYKFTGNKTEVVKQIGNAVPRRLARALCLAAVGQSPNIAHLINE